MCFLNVLGVSRSQFQQISVCGLLQFLFEMFIKSLNVKGLFISQSVIGICWIFYKVEFMGRKLGYWEYFLEDDLGFF